MCVTRKGEQHDSTTLGLFEEFRSKFMVADPGHARAPADAAAPARRSVPLLPKVLPVQPRRFCQGPDAHAGPVLMS